MKMFGPNENIIPAARPLWSEMFAEMAQRHENVIALAGDLSRSTCTEVFRKTTPERYFNVGIAEQNMVSIAAGLALNGKVPYCITFAPFATLRAGEQFRQDACYMNLNVRLLAAYGGLVSPAGPSHSGLEDAGAIRGMANATVVCPSDENMIAKVFEASATYQGPMYIRLGTGANEPVLYNEDYEYVIGKALIPREGKDATIISFGMMLRFALEAAEILAEKGIDVGVVDMHTIKPIDRDAVVQAARRTGRIVTLEEHSIYNGLGSAVAETLMEAGAVCKFKRLGIPDVFPCYGDPAMLRTKYGLDTTAVVKTIEAMM